MADFVQSIEKVFQGRAFRIPSYQRGYAWREKQWNDLWEDLELLPLRRIHFTGTLVIKNPDGEAVEFTSDEGRHYTVYDVIDGQQRLTTIILLLTAIFDEMVLIEQYKKLANGLRENYLYNTDEDGHTFTLLNTHPDAQEYFRSILKGERDPQGERNRTEKLLYEGKAFFSARLQEMKETLDVDFPDYLKKLYTRVTGQLSLIVYVVDTDLDAGVIFETMNDRGRPLTELDKVKNYLLYVCSKLDIRDGERMDLAKKINLAWSRIFEEFTSAGLADDANENQLLRAHWLMAYDYDQNRWAQSRTIKEAFSLRKYAGRDLELFEKLEQYVDTLYRSVIAYCDINRPDRRNSFNDIPDVSKRAEIRVVSTRLARLGARAGFHPILMGVRLCCLDRGEGYAKIADLCERFDFRVYTWNRYQARVAQSILFRLGNEYFRNRNLEALAYGLRKTIWEYCPDATLRQGFASENENWYRWNGLKYFLYEYEQHMADAAGVPVRMPWETLVQSRKENTIEHILPQTPVDEYWTSRFPTVEDRDRWTNDIGNLTLTYDNSPMSNKPFRKGIEDHDDKVSYYEDSSLFIERCLKDYPEWTPNTIIKRREEIMAWTLERWKVEPPASTNVNGTISVANLSDKERRQHYLEKFFDDADHLGNGKEFRQLFEVCKKFPLYLYLNPKYYAPSFNLPNHKTTCVIWLGPDLYIHIMVGEFCRHFNLDVEKVKEIVPQERRTLRREEVPDYIHCLEQLLSMIHV